VARAWRSRLATLVKPVWLYTFLACYSTVLLGLVAAMSRWPSHFLVDLFFFLILLLHYLSLALVFILIYIIPDDKPLPPFPKGLPKKEVVSRLVAFGFGIVCCLLCALLDPPKKPLAGSEMNRIFHPVFMLWVALAWCLLVSWSCDQESRRKASNKHLKGGVSRPARPGSEGGSDRLWDDWIDGT
jgi:amino acid transporter